MQGQDRDGMGWTVLGITYAYRVVCAVLEININFKKKTVKAKTV